MRMLLRIPHSSASIKVNLENETQYLDEFKLKYKLKVKRSSYWNSICADAKHNTLKPMTIESRLPSWLDCSIFFFQWTSESADCQQKLWKSAFCAWFLLPSWLVFLYWKSVSIHTKKYPNTVTIFVFAQTHDNASIRESHKNRQLAKKINIRMFTAWQLRVEKKTVQNEGKNATSDSNEMIKLV